MTDDDIFAIIKSFVYGKVELLLNDLNYHDMTSCNYSAKKFNKCFSFATASSSFCIAPERAS